jgi:hypothetical protein
MRGEKSLEEPRSVVGEWLSLVEHLVRDQGVGGSNPLSPTILFKYFRNRREPEDFQKDLHSRCRHRLLQKLAPHRSGSHTHRFNSFFPPCAVVDVLGHINIRVPHIVPRHFRPDAYAAHQAGVHGSEATEIHRVWQPEFLDRRLELSPQQISSVHWPSRCVRENQIARIPMF